MTRSSMQTLDEKVLSGRILGRGAPLLYELDTWELKSILAHEFAHFTGKETLYAKRVPPVFHTTTSLPQVEDPGGFQCGHQRAHDGAPVLDNLSARLNKASSRDE